jgi:hypothetical protein
MWWRHRVEHKLDWIIKHRLKQEETFLMAWDDIKKDVKEVGDAAQALVLVLDDVRKQLKTAMDAAKDGEYVPLSEIEAIHAELDKHTGEMAKAVVDGTPSDNPNKDHETAM